MTRKQAQVVVKSIQKAILNVEDLLLCLEEQMELTRDTRLMHTTKIVTGCLSSMRAYSVKLENRIISEMMKGEQKHG